MSESICRAGTAEVWIILPVKDFALAKARLAPALPAQERERLARRLARHTFEVVRSIGLSPVVVVTGGQEPARLAREHGFLVLFEETCGHSQAVSQAVRHAVAAGARGILTLATDLPLLAAEDVAGLRRQLAPRTMVIAPDRRGTGTNALAIAPPAFTFHFGPDSLRWHLAEARRRGLAVRRQLTVGLAVDLDTAADLELASRWPGAPALI